MTHMLYFKVLMVKQKSNKSRTYARNRPVVSRRGLENVFEPDGVYLFKLVMVMLGGLFWIRFADPIVIADIFTIGSFPAGALIVLILIAWLEPAQFNRKILYAVLMVITVVSFLGGAGLVL